MQTFGHTRPSRGKHLYLDKPGYISALELWSAAVLVWDTPLEHHEEAGRLSN